MLNWKSFWKSPGVFHQFGNLDNVALLFFSDAQCCEANVRPANRNMRNMNPHKSVKGESFLHTDTFVTISSAGKNIAKTHEAIRPCIFCKSELINDSCD